MKYLKSSFKLFIILTVFFLSTSLSHGASGVLTTTLRYGMKDIQVKYLQEFLNEKGYTVATSGIGSKGQESTYFGPATLNAVKAYQRAYSLVADGIFGAKSRATLSNTTTNNNTNNTSTTKNNTSYKQGCTATTLYSATTGLPCKETSNTSLPTGCTSTSLFSSITGQRCNQTTNTTYKPGCSATSKYSATTGLSCTTNTTTGGGTTSGGGGGGGSKGTDDKKTSNNSPTVSISTSNTSFTSPANITISATANDTDGTISKVDFYNGSTLLYTDTTSPYAFSWTSVPTGTYTLKAIATDNSNATTTSSTVKVTVSSTTNTSVSQLTITSVVDTADTHESTTPIVNTYDNSLTTRWAARQASNNGTNNVGVDIVFDLGATQSVSQTKLSFYQWNASRIYQYNIALSTNSTSWTTVVNNKSSSATQFTTDTFTATNARYVRVKFISQNQGSWAGLYEAQILGKTLISLPSNTPPTISISTSNTSFTSPANITISATASDTDGTISKVDFYNGSTLIHSDTTSPYTFSWTSVPTGTYTLKAVATDNSNASTTSSSITVNVNTVVIPPASTTLNAGLLSSPVPLTLGTGTTYYVSSSSGNDSNSGTSSSSPFKTISKVNSLNLQPGDNVLFKRGDVWQMTDSFVISKSGTASNKITFSTYGSGAKPIITTKSSVPGWNNPSNWTYVSGETDVNGEAVVNVWKINYVSNMSIDRMWLNGVDAKWASNYKLREFKWGDDRVLYAGDNGDGTTGIVETHPYFYKESNDTLYVYSPSNINPANYYQSMEFPGVAVNGVAVRDTMLITGDYITLDNIDIQGSFYASLGLAGADYITIQNSNIGKNTNWMGVIGDRGIMTEKGTSNITIVNNSIDSDWDYDYMFYTARTPYGVAIGDNTNNWNVYNNLIKDWWFSSAVVGHYGNSQDHNIHNNEITSNGIFSKAIQISAGGDWLIGHPELSETTNTRFYNNYVHDIVFGVQISADYNYIYNNIFKNLLVNSANEHGINDGGLIFHIINDWQNANPDHNYMFNNSILNTRNYATTYDGKYAYYYNNLYSNSGKERPYLTRTNKSSYVEYKNNIFYKTGATNSTDLIGMIDVGQYSVNEFNALSGQYNKLISNNIQHTGELTTLINPSTFTIPSGSPAISSGVDISSFTPMGFKDIYGNTINRTNPNIGAVQN